MSSVAAFIETRFGKGFGTAFTAPQWVAAAFTDRVFIGLALPQRIATVVDRSWNASDSPRENPSDPIGERARGEAWANRS
jgi:hypothetical protein